MISTNSLPVIFSQKFTKLPLEVVVSTNTLIKKIILDTPMGTKMIELTEEKYSSLFFGNSKKQKRCITKIVKNILEIEQESKDFLLDKWVKKI